ncbi:hypothetical protein J7643_03725 [bacterium]|nr:hypothetical protein [bacterium]
MDFRSFGALAGNLDGVRRRLAGATSAELEAQGAAIEATAKSKFGTYQAGWSPLADSTKADRSQQGFTPNDPLFRSGGLRDAVHHRVEGDSVFVGIEPGQTLYGPDGKGVDAALVMAVQEYGDSQGRVPPRPVFGTVVIEDFDRHVEAFVLGVLTRSEL